MKILVTGSNGMLGSDLVTELASTYEVCGFGRKASQQNQIQYIQADLTKRSDVLGAITTLKPAIIIHTAAFTDVDDCELNPYQAFSVNVKGTEWVAQASDSVGATLFFISTDYVFDGNKQLPYNEEDLPNPLNVYGRSKFEAEEFLKSHCRSTWIIRSSWLFGSNGKNFFRSVLQAVARNEKLRVVNDQKGAPTYTRDLAKALRSLIEKGNRVEGCRIYHLASAGAISWFQAAKKILEKINSKVELEAISSEKLKRPAKRPLNSVFDMARIKKDFGIQIRSWEEAFDEFWDESLEKEWQNLTVSQ